MILSFTIANEEELDAAAERILKAYPDYRIFTLTGDLGAGKTALVKALCRVLGIAGEVSSPTFSIVHEYSNGHTAYHFDLYRLESEKDLYQIGFEDYFDGNSYIFIEWPEIAEDLLTENYISINISIIEENSRKIDCQEINFA